MYNFLFWFFFLLLIPLEKVENSMERNRRRIILPARRERLIACFNPSVLYASAEGTNRKPEFSGSLKVVVRAEAFPEAFHTLQNS